MIPAGNGGLDERAKRLLALALMGGNVRHVPVRYDRQAGRGARLPRPVPEDAANVLSPDEDAPSFGYGPDADDAAELAPMSGADAARAGQANRLGRPRFLSPELEEKLERYGVRSGAPRLPRSVRDEAANALGPDEDAPSFGYGPDADDAAELAPMSGADGAARAGHANRLGRPRFPAVELVRKMAVREAKAYLARAKIDRHAKEDGFYAVYKPRTGEIRYYRGREAGTPGTDDFEFSIRANIGNDVLLVTGHSHPRGYCNRANEIRRPRDLNKCDRRLWQVAPFVIRNPSGRVVVLEPPEKFESLEWLNQFDEVDCEPDHRKCR